MEHTSELSHLMEEEARVLTLPLQFIMAQGCSWGTRSYSGLPCRVDVLPSWKKAPSWRVTGASRREPSAGMGMVNAKVVTVGALRV